jgi:hypothetical protein
MGNAHVDKVTYARALRSGYGRADRSQIHPPEFRRLGRCRVWRSDQVNQCGVGRNPGGERRGIKCVTDNWLCASWQFPFGPPSHEREHRVPAIQQRCDQRPAEIPSATGDEYGSQRL